MNAPPALLHRKPTRGAVRPRTPAAQGGGMCPVAAGRGPEVGGGRQKIWRVHTCGLGGLQPLDIPQNGQSFLWKSLDKNSLDLERLAEILGRLPSFRRFARPPRRRRHSIAAAFRMHTIVA